MSNKSIIINEKSHSELVKLSKTFKMNYGCFVSEMIYYFKKTGIDPKEAQNKNPSELIGSLDRRIVSFMKVQERDILKPLRQEVFNYQNIQKEEVSKLTAAINNSSIKSAEASANANKALNEKANSVIKIQSDNIVLTNNNDVKRTKFVVAELEKNRKAILLICQLIEDKNKTGTMDKIKNIFS